MNRLLRWVRRTLETKPTSGHGMHSFRPQLEQLDERLLPSLSSAISIQHSYWNFKTQQINSWTERDWFTVDQSTAVIVEYQGTSGHVMHPDDSEYHLKYLALSATVDPSSGNGAVFALEFESGDTVPFLVYYASNGASLGRWGWQYQAISATRDCHVYGVTPDGSDVQYSGLSGSFTDLGAPNTAYGTGVLIGTNSLAASVGWFGGNEVFAIGRDGYIYVNSSTTPTGWRLVDNRAQFTNLSATPQDTVFAVATDGRLFQENEHFQTYGIFGFFYWTDQDISGSKFWTGPISADTDVSGHDEVYAIQAAAHYVWNGSGYTEYLTPTGYLFLYDQGSWTQKDSGVTDVSGADGGYFYDVNYDNGSYDAYQSNPNGGRFAWTYLGSNLQ